MVALGHAQTTFTETVPMRITKFDKLAYEIRIAHSAVEDCARESVLNAVRAGKLLHHAKAEMKYGTFMGWVQKQCQFSHETANLYMRLAQGWDAIRTRPDSQCVANLGLNAVDAWLREQQLAATATTATMILKRSPEFLARLLALRSTITSVLQLRGRTDIALIELLPEMTRYEQEHMRELLLALKARADDAIARVDREIAHDIARRERAEDARVLSKVAS